MGAGTEKDFARDNRQEHTASQLEGRDRLSQPSDFFCPIFPFENGKNGSARRTDPTTFPCSQNVREITAKAGRKKLKVKGLATWSVILKKLKVGKTKVTLTATGPGGTSTPAKVTITRK